MFQNVLQQAGLGGTASPTEFSLWRRNSGLPRRFSYAFTVANLTGEAVPEQVQATRQRLLPAVRRECATWAHHGRRRPAERAKERGARLRLLAASLRQRSAR
jgi:hypothetical protein